MVILDATIVNVALPTIGHDLKLSEANLQWIINAYTLVFGGFLLLGGRAGDRRVDGVRLRDHRGAVRRLGLRPHDRVLRARRGAADGVRADRATGRGAARPAVDLPDPLPGDGQRRDVPRRFGPLCDVLLQ